MIQRGLIADLLKKSDNEILVHLPAMLQGLSTPDVFNMLELMEDTDIFRGRLPLRLKLYGKIAESAPQPPLKILALLRLLRRLGSRKDLPDLGDIPEDSADFAVYLQERAKDLCEDESLALAVANLAIGTRAFRMGELDKLQRIASEGLAAMNEIREWFDPPEILTISDLVVAETGHELIYLASNAAFRSGDVEEARRIAEDWSERISRWELALGPMQRQRYQYYQLVGHLNQEVGSYEVALDAYNKALDYAPTQYRKAFLWLSLAQIERSLGRNRVSWDHASNAIEALLESPYPQVATTWIEWLALDADSDENKAEIEEYRLKLSNTGGVEINRVTRAMASFYRLSGSLREGADPGDIAPVVDKLAKELEEIESWPNLVALLATRAVIAGRLDDKAGVENNIEKARELILNKIGPDAQPPALFFLENAHALALRDVGAYDEAFTALFEGALEARNKYPGGIGPEEQVTFEALYYLGALAGHDPETIERRIRDTISNKE